MVKTFFIRWRSGVAAMLLGALFLAVLSTANPLPADVEANAAALPADLAKIPSDAAFLVSGRVADLWGSELLKPALQKYRKEIDEGPMQEFKARIGLPMEQIERMTLLILSPPPPPPAGPLLCVRTVKPYDLANVIAAGKNVKPKKYKGEMLYVGDENWTIYPLDDRSVVYGKLSEVNGLIDHPQPKTEGHLASALRLAAGKHSIVLGVNVKRFYDSIGSQLPGEVEPFLPLLKSLSATFRLDLAADSRAATVLAFDSENDAKAAIKPAEAGVVLLRAAMSHFLTEADKHPEDKESWGNLLRLVKQFQNPLKEMRIEQNGAELRATLEAKLDTATVALTLVQYVQKVREAAARSQSANNLRQFAIAMQNYADTMGGRFPPQATYDKNGKPLLSWRVMILPFLGEKNLYNQFHLNEAWDSEHNKKLLAKMPKTYASPQDEKTIKEFATHYQGFFGKGAIFESKQGIRFPADILDGTSNTILVVEASKVVPWTKPEDIAFDPDKPLPKLGLPGAPHFLAAMCDGSVRTISHKITKETLRNAIMRNDGNSLGPDFEQPVLRLAASRRRAFALAFGSRPDNIFGGF